MAIAGGVGTMICNATHEGDWQTVVDLANRHPRIKSYLGVHPWFADTVTAGWLQRLALLLRDGSGIGEVGLDHLVPVDRALQEQVFLGQMDLAVRLGRPVTIHCLKAWGRMLELLQDYSAVHAGLLFHSFGGSREVMRHLLDMGAFFSFSAALADPRRAKMRQVFMDVPLDRLLLETDAPDQYVPALFAPKQPLAAPPCNQPCHIPTIYAFAGGLRKVDPERFRDILWKNVKIFTD